MKRKKFSPQKGGRKRTSKKVKLDQVIISKDPRLDKLLPLLMKVIGLLLGSAGMLRYRRELEEQVREVMNNGKKKDTLQR